MIPISLPYALVGCIVTICGIGMLQADPSKKALKLPSLPHLSLNPEERHLDIEATICLHQGKLELIACTRNTKEHESLVAIKAKPKHVHLMLTLLGAKSGHPPGMKALDEAKTRWKDVPAHGHPVKASLVYQDSSGKTIDKPIQYFLKNAEGKHFHTSTFLFAGSRLKPNPKGPASYLADYTGHFLTLSSFGDDVLCLPKFQSQANAQLEWEVHPGDLPKPGSNIILRLHPHPPGKP